MNHARLTLLLDVLAHVPPARFNLAQWVSNPETLVDGRATCGTVACAAGWLALDPRAQAEGLELRMLGSSPWIFYKDATLVKALAEFFDIALEDADRIFLPYGYSRRQIVRGVTPAIVVRRVRKIMKEGSEANAAAIDRSVLIRFIHTPTKSGRPKILA